MSEGLNNFNIFRRWDAPCVRKDAPVFVTQLMVLDSSNHVLRCKMGTEIETEEWRWRKQRARIQSLKEGFENCFRTLLLTSHWPEMFHGCITCMEANKDGLYSGLLGDRLKIPLPQKKRTADMGEQTVPGVCNVPVPLHQFFYDLYFFLSLLPKLFFYNSYRKMYHQQFPKLYETRLSPKSPLHLPFCSNY